VGSEAPYEDFARKVARKQKNGAELDKWRIIEGQVFLTSFRVAVNLGRMARRTHCPDAGYVYHLLNRAVGRATLETEKGSGQVFLKKRKRGQVRFS